MFDLADEVYKFTIIPIGQKKSNTFINYVSDPSDFYLSRLIYKYSFNSKTRQTSSKSYQVDTAAINKSK